MDKEKWQKGGEMEQKGRRRWGKDDIRARRKERKERKERRIKTEERSEERFRLGGKKREGEKEEKKVTRWRCRSIDR